ncbi:bifunctional 2-polyprenyl-6-hydroxyphenol methylase/3-demethylubiquinol 3-O-methyltransferase UbiG [Solimonas marina]|uniref:Ubiquinone biosynthesis O-methyltransferase n=1 Tax=Solimonas marina TaxID=2714601 RepID=A0A969W9W9_9GAMM|nr:bifunctional 2-polyprenyl-6-hydroxyphenol methylase/3-demethylubiquinol 3-O-methyltransferase UbiG [Solimonas marina]NKF22678.1 bifunctional 2-polyprenyl-6-hydroxyphenol methylase/3-demethylubiquinol 3-O-methyltransferase UbiG [Solimonas marina]
MTHPASEGANVDAREIANFGRLASRWWDVNGEMATLHQINPPRVRYVEQCAGGLGGKRALDVGCGGGLLSEALTAKGAEVTGIDMAPELIEVAKLHALESGLQPDYRQIAVETLAAEQAGHYDVVCCMEMLEHVPDPASVIAACATLVRPGGTVIFSTINRNPKAFMLAIVGAEYLTGLVERGTHEYEKFIRPSELHAWARRAGLEPIGLRGLRYNPVLKSARLSDDISVNYFMHCRRPA